MTYKRFVVMEEQRLSGVSGGMIKIIKDTKTGVHYLVTGGLGSYGITPLLDNSGQILITEYKMDIEKN